MFTLHITPPLSQAVSQANAAVNSAFSREDVNAIVGRASAQLVKEHLYGLANTRHRPKVGINFYEDAGDATSFEIVADGAEIRVDKAGVAQRFYGGDIYPVNKSHLWIPAEGSRAEEEGRAPGEFWPYDHVVFSALGKGQGFAEKDGEILFWLVNHVHQDPDPSVMPSESDFQESANSVLSLLTMEP